MDPMTAAVVGSQIIGGVSSLFGGGGYSSKDHNRSIRAQYRLSREDLPLRVEAYKDAGIHPLYGMGGGAFQPQVSAPPQGSEPSMGERLADASQNISRAASAFTTREQRAQAAVRDGLALERMQLENDLLRSQITSVNRTNIPALPADISPSAVPGQGDAFEGGSIPDVGLGRSQSGNKVLVPSEDMKQRIEDMAPAEAQWYMRQLMSPPHPNYGYDPLTGEYFDVGERSLRGDVTRAKRFIRGQFQWRK